MTHFPGDIAPKVEQAVTHIRSRSNMRPKFALVLGSGMSSIADELDRPVNIPYSDIPFFGRATAPSHRGNLYFGYFQNFPLLILQGRLHLYEGYSPAEATFPIRVLAALGIEQLLLTNASGGINQAYSPTDLCVLVDHIDLPGMMGADPMRAYGTEQGPVFTGMHNAYDVSLINDLCDAASRVELNLHKSVYASVVGPCFETPAEIRMLQAMGADIVGMSTTWEVKVARSLSMKVASLSGISNMAIKNIGCQREHSEVEIWDNLKIIEQKIRRVLLEFFHCYCKQLLL